MKSQQKELSQMASSPYMDSASSSVREHRRVLRAVVTLIVAAIAATAAWGLSVARRARRERVLFTDTPSRSLRDDRQKSESASPATDAITPAHGINSASNGSGFRPGDAADGVEFAADGERRSRRTAAVAVFLVPLSVGAIVALGAFANHSAPMTAAGSPAALHQALTYAANTPPAQLIPAAQSENPFHEPYDGQRFDGQRFNLEFGKPWLVTQVGLRPLELIPGRRVTKLRWELNDPDRTSFVQDAGTTEGGYVASTLTLGEHNYRTTSIAVTVLSTIPAPDASPSASPADRPPLVAYGNCTGDPIGLPTSGFARPAETNVNADAWVAQHESTGALTVQFRRPITLTSILIAPKAGA